MSDFFKDFRPISEKEWKQKVQAELNGQDYTQALCKNSPEGFQIKPLYTHHDVAERTTVQNETDWNIISYFTNGHNVPYDLLDGVLLTEENVSQFHPTDTELLFLKSSSHNKLEAPNKNTILVQDVVGQMIFTGKKIEDFFLKNFKISSHYKSFINTLSIELDNYHNAGATITQQLAVMLSIAQEYIHLSSPSVLNKPVITFALGSDFFSEIAKLRAARILWANFCSAYEIESQLEIFAQSSLRNKSAMDKYNNIIRSSFEGLSAVMGGANHVMLNPYDQVFKAKKDVSHELSFKQQLIMKEESMFNQFTDPTSGNYFVESLTHQLAEKAWQLFKEWEKQGGFITCLKKGIIQDSIIKHAKQEQQSFENKEKIMIGVNVYPSPQDSVDKNDLEINHKKQNKVDFKTIPIKRLAQDVEIKHNH